MPVLVFCDMAYYERNMPHWHPEGKAIVLTWRLYGSLDKFRPTKTDPGKAFVEMDRELDRATFGASWLKITGVAAAVEDALHFGERQLKLYSPIAHVITPNHVHVVLQPDAELSRITKSIKGFTARKCNEILGRTGERFWQDESYDHWVRSDRELQKIIAYIERNPVGVGLVDSIEDWPWSSASRKNNTGKNACATP
jgi:putative transposase